MPRPELDNVRRSTHADSDGRHRVRWGAALSGYWDWGERFRTPEEVFAFSPLAQGDFTDIPVVESRDYSDEEKLYESYRGCYPADRETAVEGDASLTPEMRERGIALRTSVAPCARDTYAQPGHKRNVNRHDPNFPAYRALPRPVKRGSPQRRQASGRPETRARKNQISKM